MKARPEAREMRGSGEGLGKALGYLQAHVLWAQEEKGFIMSAQFLTPPVSFLSRYKCTQGCTVCSDGIIILKVFWFS